MANAPLTISAIRTYNACKKKYYYQYVLGYSPIKKDDALDFGTKVHQLLECFWGGKVVSVSSDPKLEVMIQGYGARWIGDLQRYKVIAVEKEFLITIQGHRFAGKMDVVVLDTWTGLIYVLEHKTTSEDISPTSHYWQRLVLDDQVSMYSVACKEHYPDYQFGGVIYDVLKKHKEEPYKATPIEERKYTKKDGKLYAIQRENDETQEEFLQRITEKVAANPQEYYARHVVTRTEMQLDELSDELVSNACDIDGRMVGFVTSALFPRNPGSCFNYNRRCCWHDVCTGCDSLSNTSRFVKLEKVNKELEFDMPQE